MDVFSLTFWIALGVGFLLAYALAPQPTVVYRYPTAKNAGQVTYADKQGVCYKYSAMEVPCPTDNTHVEQIPTEN